MQNTTDDLRQSISQTKRTCHYFYQTPIGKIQIVADEQHLYAISYRDRASESSIEKENEVIRQTIHQLKEYFEGKRKEFNLPLAPQGTPFQQKVWQALLAIPYGQTRSYGQIAAAIGKPQACRAIGMTNHRNPIAIVIPCHRVIGANGKMVGYAGGVEIKEQLLALEQNIIVF